MGRSLLVLAAVALVAGARGSDYSFVPNADTATVEVRIEEASKTFRMPAWIPGDYELMNYGRFVVDPQFFKGNEVVTARHEGDENAWEIPEGATMVRYAVKPSFGNFSPNLQIRPEEVYVNGGGVFGYFEGHKDEKVTLTLPSNAVTSLKPKNDKWTAADYDELIDSPIVIGAHVRIAETKVHEKMHRVVAFGRNENVDIDAFLATGTKIADQCFTLFGELPYDQYTYFLDFGGSGGGLEHKDCTRIGMSANSSPTGAVGVMFHEYFHCFNVKRIRAKVLGPFDYSKPAVTGTLWWLEGVTDYYAAKLACRAGLHTRESFLNQCGSTAFSVSRPAYLKVSADESSKRVWEVRGSQGFGMSYYTKGRAIGLFLDLAIVAESQGQHSLDDVVRILWKECKPPKPGYQDGRLRELVLELGGPRCAVWYDKVVMTPEPMPWDELLPLVGLKLDQRSLTVEVPQSNVLVNWP